MARNEFTTGDYLQPAADSSVATGSISIGEFDTSNWVKQRVATRLGGTGAEDSTEGLADVIGALRIEMQNLHEAFRVALAEHLGADLEGERVLNQLNQEGHG